MLASDPVKLYWICIIGSSEERTDSDLRYCLQSYDLVNSGLYTEEGDFKRLCFAFIEEKLC